MPSNDPLQDHLNGLVSYIESFAGSRLAKERTSATLSRIVRKLYVINDTELGHLNQDFWAQAAMGSVKGLDCKRGCDSCCYQLVIATIPEVIHVAEHLRSTLSEAEIAELVRAVDAY